MSYYLCVSKTSSNTSLIIAWITEPAMDPSIISIESSTKNLEEPKGLEKTLKMQLFVNALAFGGLILSKSDF